MMISQLYFGKHVIPQLYRTCRLPLIVLHYMFNCLLLLLLQTSLWVVFVSDGLSGKCITQCSASAAFSALFQFFRACRQWLSCTTFRQSLFRSSAGRSVSGADFPAPRAALPLWLFNYKIAIAMVKRKTLEAPHMRNFGVAGRPRSLKPCFQTLW